MSPASTVKQNYQKLDQDITEVAFYEPIHLLKFKPTDCYFQCHWIEILYRMPYRLILEL